MLIAPVAMAKAVAFYRLKASTPAAYKAGLPPDPPEAGEALDRYGMTYGK